MSINQKTHKNNLFSLKNVRFGKFGFHPISEGKKLLNQLTCPPSLACYVDIEGDKVAKRDIIVIYKFDFAAKNLTSNAGRFLLLEYAKNNGIF